MKAKHNALDYPFIIEEVLFFDGCILGFTDLDSLISFHLVPLVPISFCKLYFGIYHHYTLGIEEH